MNTKQLPYILAIASFGNLSEAAKTLGISQPALSKYLNRLEHQIGIPLFYRDKKRFIPTPAGQVYLETAQEILSLQLRTKEAIAQLNHPHSTFQELHIGLSPHRGASLLSQFFPDFIRRFPQVHLIPHEGYGQFLQKELLEKRISLAISSQPETEDPRLHFIPQIQEEVVLAVPDFHQSASKYSSSDETLPFVSLADFADSTFVTSSRPSTTYFVSQSLFQKAGFHPVTVFSSPNIVMLESMIRTGCGVGLLPAEYIKPHSGLVYFRLKEGAFVSSGLLIRAGHKLSIHERYIIYLLLQLRQTLPENSLAQIAWNPLLQDIAKEFSGTYKGVSWTQKF